MNQFCGFADVFLAAGQRMLISVYGDLFDVSVLASRRPAPPHSLHSISLSCVRIDPTSMDLTAHTGYSALLVEAIEVWIPSCVVTIVTVVARLPEVHDWERHHMGTDEWRGQRAAFDHFPGVGSRTQQLRTPRRLWTNSTSLGGF